MHRKIVTQAQIILFYYFFFFFSLLPLQYTFLYSINTRVIVCDLLSMCVSVSLKGRERESERENFVGRKTNGCVPFSQKKSTEKGRLKEKKKFNRKKLFFLFVLLWMLSPEKNERKGTKFFFFDFFFFGVAKGRRKFQIFIDKGESE